MSKIIRGKHVTLRDESKPVRNVTTHVVKPELTTIPPCRECGRIPSEFARFDNGQVQCIGDELRHCYFFRGEETNS